MSSISQSQFKNNNVLLPPHLLFEATRLNGPATTSSPPKSWSELAMSESVHDVEAMSSESVASNHVSDCDHRHQEVSSSFSSSSAKAFLVHGLCSFEADHRPPAPALLLKKNKPSSSSSSSSSNNRSYVDRTSLSVDVDVDDTSASTITTHSGEPMKKKQKLEKGSDLEGLLCLPHQIFHYFRAIYNENKTKILN